MSDLVLLLVAVLLIAANAFFVALLTRSVRSPTLSRIGEA